MRIFKHLEWFYVVLGVILALAAVACLTGCESLGLPKADSFDKRLAYAYGEATAVVQATSQGLNDHDISSKDAKEVSDQAKTMKLLLDSAVELRGTNPGAANAKLTLALTSLQALQTYLRTRTKDVDNKPVDHSDDHVNAEGWRRGDSVEANGGGWTIDLEARGSCKASEGLWGFDLGLGPRYPQGSG